MGGKPGNCPGPGVYRLGGEVVNRFSVHRVAMRLGMLTSRAATGHIEGGYHSTSAADITRTLVER